MALNACLSCLSFSVETVEALLGGPFRKTLVERNVYTVS